MAVQRAKTLGKRIFAGVVFVCSAALAMPHLSYAGSARSSAGGGDITSMDWGKVGTSVGISIGGAVVGSVIGGAFQSAQSTSTATSNIGKGLDATGKMLSSTSPWVSSISSISASGVLTTMGYGYNAYMAGTQVGRAIGAAGQYYDWGNGTTYLLSSIGSSAAGGFLNPSASLGDSATLSSGTSSFFSAAAHPMLSGALVGAAGGAAYGAAVLGIDGDKIRAGQDPGVAAMVAGTGASLGATILARTALDYRTYTVKDKSYKTIDDGGNKYVVTKDGMKVPESEFRKTGLDEFQYRNSDKTFGGPLEDSGIGRGTEATYGDVGALMRGSNVGTGDTATTYQNARAYLDESDLSFDTRGMTQGEVIDYARDNGFTGDRTHTVHFAGKKPMDVTLDNQQTRFLENTRYGTTPGSFNAPEVKFNADGSWDFVKPKLGVVAGRLSVGVIAETLNQWPSVAATGLALLATDNMDKNWKPFVYGMVNTVASSSLDGLANTYSLKPSLIGSLNNNLDTKLGYFPELKYQQQQLFLRTALSGTISDAIKDKKIDSLLDPKVKYLVTDAEAKQALLDNDKTKTLTMDQLNGMDRQQLEDLMRTNLANDAKYGQGKVVTAADILPDSLKMSQTQKDAILADFVGKRNTAFTSTTGMKFDDAIAKSQIYAKVKNVVDFQRLDYRDMTVGEMRQALSGDYLLKNQDGTYKVNDDAVKTMASQAFTGKTGLDILKDAGGSRLTTLGMIGTNVLRSDLPVSALAGLINVGFNEGIKAAVGSNATTDDTQLAALTGVAAASIARGTVGWIDRSLSLKRELASIQAGKFDPEMASWRTVQGNADIYQARMRGDIPLPETYSVVEKFYEDEKGNRLPVQDVQAKVDSIRDRLSTLGIQIPQYDVSKTDLDTIRRGIQDELDRRNRTVTGTDATYLVKIDSSLGSDIDSIGTKVQDFMRIEKGAIPGKDQVLYKPTTITIDNIYAVKAKDGDVQVFDRLDRQTENGVLSKNNYYSMFRGELTEKSRYTLDGERIDGEVYPLAAVPSLGNTIFGNLRQGMFEMGWQTMAMGLPHSQGGKLSAYAWNSYRQNLVSNINSARYRGFFTTMQLNSIDVMKGTETSSSGIIENFGIYTLANTPAGDLMKLSRYVPVSGYKGLPYSEAYVSEVGLNSANVIFYPGFPYYSVRAVPVDPFARYLRNMRASSINPNDQVLAPSGEGPRVKLR